MEPSEHCDDSARPATYNKGFFVGLVNEERGMKLACQEHLICGSTLIEKWEFISSVGYDGIELHGHGDFNFRERLPELREA
jgi:hypothetical protein